MTVNPAGSDPTKCWRRPYDSPAEFADEIVAALVMGESVRQVTGSRPLAKRLPSLDRHSEMPRSDAQMLLNPLRDVVGGVDAAIGVLAAGRVEFRDRSLDLA